MVKLCDTHEPYVKTVVNNCNSRPMLSLFSSLGNRCNCSAGLYPCWVELSSLVACAACSPNGFGKTQFQAMYFTKHAHARYRYEHAHKRTIHTPFTQHSVRGHDRVGQDSPHQRAPASVHRAGRGYQRATRSRSTGRPYAMQAAVPTHSSAPR